MSRNHLFLLIASAVAVMIMSSHPLPLSRPAIVTFAELPPLSQDGTHPADIAMLEPSLDER